MAKKIRIDFFQQILVLISNERSDFVSTASTGSEKLVEFIFLS